MKLNHVGLTVTNVSLAAKFLQTHFGMKPVGSASSKMGHVMDEGGLVLSLFREGYLGAPLSRPEGTHIGFMVGSKAEVDAKHRELAEAGYDVPEPRHAHGYTFTFTAPGGFAVEVVS